MEVRVKKFDVNMQVKTNGIEFEVRQPDATPADGTIQFGDCILTKTGLIWCGGRTGRDNGIKVTWAELAIILGSDDTKKAALKAARAA